MRKVKMVLQRANRGISPPGRSSYIVSLERGPFSESAMLKLIQSFRPRQSVVRLWIPTTAAREYLNSIVLAGRKWTATHSTAEGSGFAVQMAGQFTLIQPMPMLGRYVIVEVATMGIGTRGVDAPEGARTPRKRRR